MRVVKLGLISLLLLFGLVTLISLMFPSHLRLSRATNLPNQRQRILALLRSDSLWHPAYQDSGSLKTYLSLDKKVLAQTDSSYVVQLQQANRKPVISGWNLYGKPAADSLTLQWYMDFRFRWYPWEKFSSLFYEQTYGVMMEKGLANLKQHLVN
ncbi:MAG TPA: hypothetical protein VFL47_06990 [Flavisolibacter sp.]|nr:hypothetical protein [Flavisolibacter sp.]